MHDGSPHTAGRLQQGRHELQAALPAAGGLGVEGGANAAKRPAESQTFWMCRSASICCPSQARRKQTNASSKLLKRVFLPPEGSQGQEHSTETEAPPSDAASASAHTYTKRAAANQASWQEQRDKHSMALAQSRGRHGWLASKGRAWKNSAGKPCVSREGIAPKHC